jgi:hypothetical protein
MILLIFFSAHIHLAMPGLSPAQALSLLGGQGEGKASSVLLAQLPQGLGEADGGAHALRRAPQVKVLLTEALSSVKVSEAQGLLVRVEGIGVLGGGEGSLPTQTPVTWTLTTSVFDLFKVGIDPSTSHTVGPMHIDKVISVLVRCFLLVGFMVKTCRILCG